MLVPRTYSTVGSNKGRGGEEERREDPRIESPPGCQSQTFLVQTDPMCPSPSRAVLCCAAPSSRVVLWIISRWLIDDFPTESTEYSVLTRSTRILATGQDSSSTKYSVHILNIQIQAHKLGPSLQEHTASEHSKGAPRLEAYRVQKTMERAAGGIAKTGPLLYSVLLYTR